MALTRLKNHFRTRRNWKEFCELPQSERKIVFYAEDDHSMVHFEEIISQLASQYNENVCYLTSDPEDPVLDSPPPKTQAFYIGEGLTRTTAFLTMPVDLLIMTMPDLENFHIKRSRVYPTHYLYLFHALVSTHSNYRQGAFDHFDTLFCTGPFQLEEIRATEKAYGLPPKRLYEDGYRRLESLMDEVQAHREREGGPAEQGPKTVIVAPSWGDQAILESCGAEVIKPLLAAGYRTIVRPHPMTSKHRPALIEALCKQFSDQERFALQLDIRDKKTLYESHVMVSDWSGVAMEYAFACERPVIYIDVPQKCNNPESDKIPQIPVEVSIREQIGKVISPQKLHELPAAIEELYGQGETFVEKIRQARERCVFHLGTSLDGAVAEIAKIAAEIRAKNQKQRDRA